jgi:hypothetical protein
MTSNSTFASEDRGFSLFKRGAFLNKTFYIVEIKRLTRITKSWENLDRKKYEDLIIFSQFNHMKKQ